RRAASASSNFSTVLARASSGRPTRAARVDREERDHRVCGTHERIHVRGAHLGPSPAQTPPLPTTDDLFTLSANGALSWAARRTRRTCESPRTSSTLPRRRLDVCTTTRFAVDTGRRHSVPRPRGVLGRLFRAHLLLHEHQYRNRRVESHLLDPCELPAPDRHERHTRGPVAYQDTSALAVDPWRARLICRAGYQWAACARCVLSK
ncbi:hypothetical protein C8F04DRAFT_1163113, partial [Mycena alexandri]